MPWQIGIDEAGYGPNLGPFVMTLVACRVPDGLHDANLWDVLKAGVRRADESADDRLIVADSKQIYSTASGLAELEKSVLSAHLGGFQERMDCSAFTLQALLYNIALDELPLLRQEAWFAGDTPLPHALPAADLAAGVDIWKQMSQSDGVAWGFCQSAVVAAPRFNDVVDKWDSKGAVLSIALTQLMQRCLETTSAEPMRFIIDKHGGRNQYSALLQHAFADGMVLGEQEGRLRSDYRVVGLDRPVNISFMPKADVEHFTVALASMFSKYVRELLMHEFNRFWQTHVPGLKPTAGYPLDAVRYFEAIRPAMAKLGLEQRQVWRSR